MDIFSLVPVAEVGGEERVPVRDNVGGVAVEAHDLLQEGLA